MNTVIENTHSAVVQASDKNRLQFLGLPMPCKECKN